MKIVGYTNLKKKLVDYFNIFNFFIKHLIDTYNIILFNRALF